MLRLSLVLSILIGSTLSADTNLLARQAAAGDGNAVRALRAMGQPGVDALLAVRTNDPKFHAAIDAVCRQRDCAWSGLYWHTDLEAAKRVAQKSARPILSLRLLGNLDEELSCANSRYFRTLLYPNAEIAKYLRANYVLHWQSERRAPVITIDFGDGRRMQRTITGNSIHYVLDAQGRPLDGIPGLYAPPEFLALLKEGAGLHRQLARIADPKRRDRALAFYHLNAASVEIRPRSTQSPLDQANEHRGRRDQRLAVWTSGTLAATKGISEGPVVDKISLDVRALGLLDDVERLVAETVRGPRSIDDNARALIRAKRASAPPTMRSEEAFEKMMEQLEKTLVADTIANEKKLHQQIHRALTEPGLTLEALNAFVYDEVFATPGADPWMGLVADSSFTGISGEGLTLAAAPAVQARPRPR